MTLSRFALAFLLFSASTSQAATKVVVNPSARAVLTRAATLYGKAPKWSGRYREKGEESKQVSIAFTRPKTMRIEEHTAGGVYIIATDGVTRTLTTKNPKTGTKSRQHPERTSGFAVLALYGNGPGEVLSSLLQGKNGIEDATLHARQNGAAILEIQSLSPVPWQGQSCSRVAFDTRYKKSEENFKQHDSYELWFTHQGQLVRTIAREQMFDSGVDVWTTDMVGQVFGGK